MNKQQQIEDRLMPRDIAHIQAILDIKAVDESFTTKDYTKVARIREQLEALNRDEELLYRADLMIMESDDTDIVEYMDSVKKRV